MTTSTTNQQREEIAGWVAGRLPDGWFTSPPTVTVDREEIVIVGQTPDVELEANAAPGTAKAARTARAQRFREETRTKRMQVADEAEHRYGRKVSWGVRCGDVSIDFTTLAVPVMTRLRQDERTVLDTLVDAGVARSRSDALAWCVKLVGANQGEWIQGLREALEHVERARAGGPSA